MTTGVSVCWRGTIYLPQVYQAQGAKEKKSPAADPLEVRLRVDGDDSDPGAHQAAGSMR